MKPLLAAVLGGDRALHERIRLALVAPLRSEPPFGFASEVSDAAVIVVAGDGPALGGLIASSHAEAPAAPVVVVGPRGDARAGRGALGAGASGLVLEEDLERTLVATLHAVVAGMVCLPRELGDEIQSPLLSMREKQVLGMVVLGFANAEIATRLFIAQSTVKSHLNSSFRKLGVRSRQEAAAAILDPARGLGTGILTIDADG